MNCHLRMYFVFNNNNNNEKKKRNWLQIDIPKVRIPKKINLCFRHSYVSFMFVNEEYFMKNC